MKYFEVLNQLVKNGQIKITFLISLPRSNSTAFELALHQAYDEQDIQMSAPWHTKIYDIEDPDEFDLGCKRIHDEVENKLKHAKKLPINILIKSHAYHLERSEFLKVLQLSNEFGFSYRDPYSQLQSMITRMGNDLVKMGGDDLKFENAVKELSTNQQLEHCITLVRYQWRYLIGQYRIVKNMATKNLLLQDGFTMRAYPEQSMQKACEVFHRDYTPRMISGWNDPTTQYTCMYTKNWGRHRLTNAWNGPAVTSTEIKRVDMNERHPENPDIFPFSCHALLDELMGYYRELAGDWLHQSYNPSDNELMSLLEVSPVYVSARLQHPGPSMLLQQAPGQKRDQSNLSEQPVARQSKVNDMK